MSRRSTAIVVLLSCCSCRPSLEAPAEAPPTPEQCRANRTDLLDLLESLPAQGLALRSRADLPVASLGGVIGSGRVLDVSAERVSLDGRSLGGDSIAEHVEAIRAGLADGAQPSAASPNVPRPLVYLAAPASMDARTLRKYLGAIPRAYDVHLVFQAPPAEGGRAADASVSERLLSETDVSTRSALAREAYRKHARCEPVQKAVEGIAAGDPSERWPALRSGLLAALPQCDCRELDSGPLRELLLAEQRAGAATVGAVPFDFMRDERCGASFGASPVQKIVQDIQTFDEEFAGEYARESLDFSQVVTNERLLTYLCPALPGETLAELSRVRHTFFWKVRGLDRCQAWQFEPLEPGSNMGTWRRRENERSPLALHYWQGAEEIRVYGPVPDGSSKPTDERVWACQQEFKMQGIDPQSIALETGRWYFDRDACQRASEDDGAFPGCIAALAGGPPEAPPAVPATFPALGDGQPEPPSPP